MSQHGRNGGQPTFNKNISQVSHRSPSVLVGLGTTVPPNPVHYQSLVRKSLGYTKFDWKYFSPPEDICYPSGFSWHPIAMFSAYCAGVLRAFSWKGLKSEEIWHHMSTETKARWTQVTNDLNSRLLASSVPPIIELQNNNDIMSGLSPELSLDWDPARLLAKCMEPVFYPSLNLTNGPNAPTMKKWEGTYSDTLNQEMGASFSSRTSEEYFDDCRWIFSDQSTSKSGGCNLSTRHVNVNVTPGIDFNTPQIYVESDEIPVLVTGPATGLTDGVEVQGCDCFLPHTATRVATASATPIEISDRSFIGLEGLTSVPSSEMMRAVWRDIIENMVKADGVEKPNQPVLSLFSRI